MKLPRNRFGRLAAWATVAGLLFIAGTGHEGWSQPAAPVKIVVPFAAGGTADTLARLLADQIGRSFGQTMVIENRPGAGSVIGTEAVARATPDGTTILLMANSFTINPSVKKLNYDPLTAFEPVCFLVRSPIVVSVIGTSTHRSIADLLSAARTKPGDLTMAGNGPASAHHIAFEMLKRAANVNMTFVPFPGSAPAVNTLLGDHVSSAITDYSDVAEQVRAGRLRALVTASRERIEALPNLPTMVEAGFADYEAEGTLGVVAPAKTPNDAISRLSGWFKSALQVPEIRTKLAAHGLYPVGACGADFGAHLRKQLSDYGRVIREANIKAE